MPKKTTLKTRRCWHKESFFCSLLLREQHLCHAAQQRAPVSTHLASAASPRQAAPAQHPHETLTENTDTAHPWLGWRLGIKYTYIRIYVFVKRGLWVQQRRRTVSLVQGWAESGAFHHWASTSWQPQECSDSRHGALTDTICTDHAELSSAPLPRAALTKNCPLPPEAPCWTRRRSRPCRAPTQRGLRCGKRPCGGGTANSPAGTTSRPGPSAPLFSPGSREGGGQDPGVARGWGAGAPIRTGAGGPISSARRGRLRWREGCAHSRADLAS